MTDEAHVKRRVERVQLETDRHVIVGDVTMPAEGYQSRFSDSLNRADIGFVPIVNVEISLLSGGGTAKRDFVLVSKAHVRIAFPIDENV